MCLCPSSVESPNMFANIFLVNNNETDLLTLNRKEVSWRRGVSPEGLVKGTAEDLTAVLGEAQTSHAFVVSVLKPTQAQSTLDFPHLLSQPTQNTHGIV